MIYLHFDLPKFNKIFTYVGILQIFNKKKKIYYNNLINNKVVLSHVCGRVYASYINTKNYIYWPLKYDARAQISLKLVYFLFHHYSKKINKINNPLNNYQIA